MKWLTDLIDSLVNAFVDALLGVLMIKSGGGKKKKK